MQRSDRERSTTELLDAIQQVFEAEAAKEMDASPILQRVLDLLPELKPNPEITEGLQLPACRHLARTLDLGEAGPAATVTRPVREMAATLVWAQSDRHTLDTRGPEFMDNYAYSGLGLTGSDILDIGILLLGPGITYPVTAYPSSGVFLVIGGSPEWKSGDGPWVRVDAGDIIHRPAGGAEGKRPGNEPMLALYAWLYKED